MSIFTNSFFSLAGQAERLTNVKDTLIAAVTGQGVKSNTGVAPLDTVLSTAASHPFSTAAVVAAAANPTAALNLVKTAGSGISKVAAANPGKAAIALAAVPTTAKLLLSSEKARSAATSVASTVLSGNIGSDLAAVVEGRSGVLDFVKEHPIVTSAAAIAGTVALAKTVPAAAAFALGGALSDNKGTETSPVIVAGVPADSRTGNVPIQDANPVTSPKAAPSAPVQVPTTTPMALPSNTAIRKTSTKRYKRKRCLPRPSGRMRQTISLRF